MNTRYILLTLVSIATLGWISALAGTEAIPADTDLGRLQGRWTARAGAHREFRVVLSIQGRRANATIKTPQGISFEVQGQVRLDETTSPRSLDWVNFSGADQQEFPQIPAIYKLDRDTFTLCNGGMNGTRPKEFKPGDGALADVVVFERERSSSDAKK
jgi:uncharacterized protein (TIGR03067 family)